MMSCFSKFIYIFIKYKTSFGLPADWRGPLTIHWNTLPFYNDKKVKNTTNAVQ